MWVNVKDFALKDLPSIRVVEAKGSAVVVPRVKNILREF